MESKRLRVSSDVAAISACADEAERFVDGLSLDKKSTLRIRLLTEEILEMVRSMVGTFAGDFWLESDSGECRICMKSVAVINVAKEKDLLSASKDGKNESVKGFTAKLSQFIRHHKEYLSKIMDAGAEYVPLDYMYIGAIGQNYGGSEVMWSLYDYRTYLYDEAHISEQVEEDRDELEKSIVANLADDVKVGVKGDDITITVIKKI